MFRVSDLVNCGHTVLAKTSPSNGYSALQCERSALNQWHGIQGIPRVSGLGPKPNWTSLSVKTWIQH
jgi:hypothetical protein